MRYFDELFDKGAKRTRDKKVVIFGMVRDCAKAIIRNIPSLEAIGNFFSDYRIVILENNSKDDTKNVLQRWAQKNYRVSAYLNDFDEGKYNLISSDENYFKYFQLNKLQKYYDYRNYLKELVDGTDFESDYSLLIDMDVARIDVKGVITSFGTEIDWDAVTANGYSYSPSFKRRYHDTFALCEYGMQDRKQTLQMIHDYQSIFSFMRKGMPFIRVFSAYGGIAIFKTKAIKGLRYEPFYNSYGKVQVRCEHFAFFYAMAEKGYNNVFINPNMEVFYQRITLGLIIKKLRETFEALVCQIKQIE